MTSVNHIGTRNVDLTDSQIRSLGIVNVFNMKGSNESMDNVCVINWALDIQDRIMNKNMVVETRHGTDGNGVASAIFFDNKVSKTMFMLYDVTENKSKMYWKSLESLFN